MCAHQSTHMHTHLHGKKEEKSTENTNKHTHTQTQTQSYSHTRTFLKVCVLQQQNNRNHCAVVNLSPSLCKNLMHNRQYSTKHTSESWVRGNSKMRWQKITCFLCICSSTLSRAAAIRKTYTRCAVEAATTATAATIRSSLLSASYVVVPKHAISLFPCRCVCMCLLWMSSGGSSSNSKKSYRKKYSIHDI